MAVQTNGGLKRFWRALGLAVAGSASILAFPGRLRELVAPVWPALRILGDVDTYLYAPTRRRLDERASRLWRYVRRAKHDRIVFIAHSQGSVIATQLLKATTEEARPPTRLLSFGSPLTHLYHRFFPHQFVWLEGDNLPGVLSVERWTNISATGDYVGMSITDSTVLEGMGVTGPRGVDEQLAAPTTRGHTSYLEPTCRELVDAIQEAIDK